MCEGLKRQFIELDENERRNYAAFMVHNCGVGGQICDNAELDLNRNPMGGQWSAVVFCRDEKTVKPGRFMGLRQFFADLTSENTVHGARIIARFTAETAADPRLQLWTEAQPLARGTRCPGRHVRGPAVIA